MKVNFKTRKKVTVSELEKVMASMTDASRVAEIKQRFYVESVMGTIRQILKTYPEDIAEDRALAFIMELADKGLIDMDEFLEMTLDLLSIMLEEGDDNEE